MDKYKTFANNIESRDNVFNQAERHQWKLERVQVSKIRVRESLRYIKMIQSILFIYL